MMIWLKAKIMLKLALGREGLPWGVVTLMAFLPKIEAFFNAIAPMAGDVAQVVAVPVAVVTLMNQVKKYRANAKENSDGE